MRHRQWPRHSGRSASEIPQEIRARSDHDDAACRRKIRLRRLSDLRRPAWRRRLGRQRAFGASSRSRSRAASCSTGRPSSAAIPIGKLETGRQGAEPARHAHALQARRADFRQGRAFQAGAPVQDGAGESLSLRRRRDPLALRAGMARARGATSRPRRCSAFPAASRIISPRTSRARNSSIEQIFSGKVEKPGGHGSLEWAIAWLADDDGFVHSYCNTIPTPDGGTHEAGLRAALLRGAEGSCRTHRPGQARRGDDSDDVMASCAALVSVFIREPEFQGQNKGRLMTAEAARIVEGTLRDAFDHWLAASPSHATQLLDWTVERAEERLRRRAEKDVARKTASAQAAAARQARGLLEQLRRKAPNYLSSKAIRQAARRSRRATAPTRPSCRCAARS